jgi:hypothetical protein
MGKRKWQRIKPTDLADPETQQRFLALMDQAKGQPAPDSPEKQASETATTGR